MVKNQQKTNLVSYIDNKIDNFKYLEIRKQKLRRNRIWGEERLLKD